MKWARSIFGIFLVFIFLLVWPASRAHGQSVPSKLNSISGGNLNIEAFDDGSYALRSTAIHWDVLRSEVEVDMAGGCRQLTMLPRNSGITEQSRTSWAGRQGISPHCCRARVEIGKGTTLVVPQALPRDGGFSR